MPKYARILDMDNDRVLVGLLNDKGLCGSGSCEGCSCSRKMQTMTVKIPGERLNERCLNKGQDVEMKLPGGTALDWFLLIFFPLILVLATAWFLGGENESLRNLGSLGAGTAGFILSALVLKRLRRDQTIDLIPLTEKSSPQE